MELARRLVQIFNLILNFYYKREFVFAMKDLRENIVIKEAFYKDNFKDSCIYMLIQDLFATKDGLELIVKYNCAKIVAILMERVIREDASVKKVGKYLFSYY